MNMVKSLSFTEGQAGKSEALMNCQDLIRYLATVILAFSLSTIATIGQVPPRTADPYVPRGNPKSPDGSYQWTVKTSNPIGYQLLRPDNGKVMVTVNAYYPEANGANLRYARACGFFWNKDGTLAALDELNRRRAGHLYFIVLHDGKAHEIPVEGFLPTPSDVDEGRIVVDPGWLSGHKIRVRQTLKTKSGQFLSKYFVIDFALPEKPRILAD
jgi:hypothetical protein